MNHDYSLELEKEKITNKKTKIYFEEIYSSYQMGNYRSTIVMLWSVIVCDVIFKIQELESVYNDPIAKNILEEFIKHYQDKSKSSEWELQLIEDVFKRTLIIDHGAMATIKHIQQYRHISAHPVLETDFDLFVPNKDLCRGLILSALIGLFTKPAYYTKKLFDEFIRDISENRDVLISKDLIKTYIDAKYTKHLQDKTKIDLVKSLWKLVFKLDNEDCAKNRVINRRVLEVLTDDCFSELHKAIIADNSYFSTNISVDKQNKALSLYHYFNTFPLLYVSLREDAKTLLKGVQDNSILTLLLSRFLYNDWDSYESHVIKTIDHKLVLQLDNTSDQDLLVLIKFHEDNKQEKIINKVFALAYSKSINFNDADTKFQKYINPFINELDIDILMYIMELSQNNNQTYDRGRSRIDHKKIKDRIIEINPEFDFTNYANFLSSVDE